MEHLKQSAAGSIVPDLGKKEHILIWYAASECGEATAQPHLRVPALRNRGDHFLRLFRFCQMRGKEATGELTDGDVYCVSDCGKDGNRHALLSRFISPATREVNSKTGKPKKLEAFKKSVRTMTAMRIHMVTRQPLTLNQHSRLHTSNSSNRGNLLEPFLADDWDNDEEQWRLPVKTKLPDWKDLEVNKRFKPRGKNDKKPFLFHSTAKATFEEIIHCINVVGVIRLERTASLPKFASPIASWGLCFTSEQKDCGPVWRKELSSSCRATTDKSKLFVPGLKVIVEERVIELGVEDPSPPGETESKVPNPKKQKKDKTEEKEKEKSSRN
ncbi:sinIM [Symbiodinium sp. CCMP2592]|nr:sinIM [Symbiodinium sp. CCMP2592]